jgi:hypothetical protein
MKRNTWVLVGFMVFAMSMIAYAAQAATGAAPVAAAATTSMGSAILMAALNGAIIGVVGWLSQRKEADGTHQDFDPVQLVVTVLVGAAIGAIAAWRKKSFGDVETWVENSGYVTLAEILLKAVWRNGSVKISGALASLKQGAATQNPTLPAPAAPAPEPPKV